MRIVTEDINRFSSYKVETAPSEADYRAALVAIARILYRRRESGASERKAFVAAVRALGYSSAAEFVKWEGL